MFHNKRHLNFVLWAALFAMASGCTGGGCNGCSFEELPEGGLPAAQTVEGGAQVRITEAGFEAIEDLIVALLDDAIGSGFELGSQQLFDITVQSGTICPTGCDLGLTVNDFVTQINPDNDSLTVGANFDANGELVISTSGIFYDGQCTITAEITDAAVSFDLGVQVNSGSGELEMYSENVNELSLGNTDVSGCGVLGDVIDAGVDLVGAVTDFLTGQLGFIFQPILNPIIDFLLDQFLPDPLGIAGVMDTGALLAGFSPSTNAKLETKLIPGGYADIVNKGLSLGMITGFNSDRDPTTRSGEAASEPVFCVPNMPAPNFAAAPHQLDTIARNYGNPFSLQPADEFLGSPDPAGTDVLFGASETMLDQLGHHLVTSGTLCLAVSTESIPQFNLGIIGLVVPSFSELGNEDGTNPLKLVIRPLEPVDFAIGTGEAGDPALQMNIVDLEIDFYAFIFERWVRGFTIRLTANVGIDLEFTTDGDGNPAVLPVLSGLKAEDLEITVLNEDFLRESAAELEAVFPTLLDLALPQITNALGEIALPDFGGFTLDNLVMSKVTTSEDDFLSISGGLASTGALLPLIEEKYPTLAAELKAMEVVKPVKVQTRARLADVSVPIPQAVRNSLLAGRTGVWPEVTIEVPTHDELGRELEYTWSLNGGLWRPFTTGGQLIIRDGAFAIQGDYDIHVRARAIGDYASLDDRSTIVPVTIDSAPPRIRAHRITTRAGVTIIPATDLVSDTVRIALSPLGAEGPTTGWSFGTVSTSELNAVAGDSGKVVVYAEDESGNQSKTVISTELTTGAAGCSATGNAGSGALLFGIAGLLGILGIGRRRRKRLFAIAAGARTPLTWTAAVIAIVLSQGCSCGSDEFACELNEDCVDFCEDGSVPLCTESGECLCADDVPYGRTGQYSSMDIANSDEVWVSAYNSTHGDLMVARWPGTGRIERTAWQFVDGVPDGPVVVEGSDIRGGITDPGDDVGLYTDVAANGDLAYVSYFDKTNGSLKLAANYDGATWEIHSIESGTPPNPEGGTFLTIGQYSSITLTEGGNPAIAYFVQEGAGGDVTTEVRYAVATVAQPRGPGDWLIETVDSAVVEGVSPGGLGIPEGLGLFINSIRRGDGTVAIAYYDRQNGTLKLATESEDGWVLEVLDGGEGLDVGWYPSLGEESDGTLHLAYVDAVDNDLLYINTADLTPELIDDGYRLVGSNSSGIPKPEFQFVGDDSALVMTPAGPVIFYQNATTHELLVAQREGDGWAWDSIAGGGETFSGGYGFYARAQSSGDDVVISTWVVDQPNFDAWVQIFRLAFGIE